MGVTKYIQNAFTAGELSPRLSARDDYDRYAQGVATMLNFFPYPHGGARVRYGSVFVGQTRDAAKAYLIPFKVSATLSYIIEAGTTGATTGYFRFFKNNARISDLTGTITGAANNGSGLIRITDVAHGLSTNDYVSISGVLGTVESNGEWKVTVITADTFDLIGSAFVNTYVSGGTWARPFVLATPYGTDFPITDIKWAQHADGLYLVHPLLELRKLTRVSDTSWTLLVFSGATSLLDGPYMDVNKDPTKTVTCSTNTLGASGTITATGFTPFTAQNDNGPIWRIKGVTSWGYIRLTGLVSSSVCNMVVMATLDFTTPGTTQTANWREGSFSKARGFPSCITIFEQRLVLAATTAEPQTIWMSTTGSYEDFTPTATSGSVVDSDAITYKIGSNELNHIRWVIGARDLLIGSVGEELSMRGADNKGLTPVTPPLVRSGTTYGSNGMQAVRIGSRVYYVQRSSRKVRSVQYNLDEDNYISPDVSLAAEHLFRTKTITRHAFQLEPDSILWEVLSDGKLRSFTIHELEQVYGWAQHETDGLYVDIAVIPKPDLTTDEAWQVVSRTVGGVVKHFVEFQIPSVDVDAGLVYDGTNAFTLTPEATTGNNVLFTASGSAFTSTDVGKQLILLGHLVNGVKWFSRATIITFVSATQVRADIVADFPNTSAVPAGSWGLGVITLTGIHHLNGRTVQIVGDGAVYDPQVVSGGSFTLKYGSTDGPHAVKVQAGLARLPNPKIITLQPAYRDAAGVIRNKFKHWATVEVAVEETMGLTINGVNEIQYRVPSDPMDVGVPAFSGDKTAPQLLTSKTGVLTFEQTLPLPATLLSYFGELEVGD